MVKLNVLRVIWIVLILGVLNQVLLRWCLFMWWLGGWGMLCAMLDGLLLGDLVGVRVFLQLLQSLLLLELEV
jgi:hypothetical protein